MRIEQNYSLKSHNTFHLPVKTRWFMEYENEEELSRILRDEYFQENISLHIGEGSNLLFINDFDGIIIHSNIKGMTVMESFPESVLLRVGAAEHWDSVVAYAVSEGWGGIENLSHIPGEAGAAAVQNIGAYGVEMKDVVETVEAYNQLTFGKRIFTKEECRYDYRHSYFKETDHDPYIITHINLRLQKTPQFKLDYGNLTEALRGCEITLQAVRNAVTEVRRNKLPEPEDLGNAGSFFMNPVIPQVQFYDLKNKYVNIPSYPASAGYVKVPAGWLIEQCGFKGKREGNVGIYEKQALIIVNHGGATGDEIALFAENIRRMVNDKFGIMLVPEVRYIQ
ncbi:MAG: UDP-N-acetylmuramate dehydrogenase [Tannerella sp.]|jgi:UDP-N-acetylmuramate dehydrogenase|nr:UDP-N-acetylmuramate dehydrogenase [Tannerella sp.]